MKNTYTIYKETHPNEKIAVLTMIETMSGRKGSIEIINEELCPMDVKMAAETSNDANGVDVILNDRVLPVNRMFFAEYCKENNINIKDINDKLKINKGRIFSDDYFIEYEVEITEEFEETLEFESINEFITEFTEME